MLKVTSKFVKILWEQPTQCSPKLKEINSKFRSTSKYEVRKVHFTYLKYEASNIIVLTKKSVHEWDENL